MRRQNVDTFCSAYDVVGTERRVSWMSERGLFTSKCFCWEIAVQQVQRVQQAHIWSNLDDQGVIRSRQLWSVHCTNANCAQIRSAERFDYPDGLKLLVFWQMVQWRTPECRISRCKTSQHSFWSKSEVIALYTAVGTNDVIDTARVSNGMFCVVTKTYLKFTFSRQ